MRKWALVLALIAALTGCDKTDYKAQSEKPKYPTSTEKASADVKPIVARVPETKKEYMASTRKIGGKKAPIYYKDLLKNPDKYIGERVNILCKVMSIHEKDGVTMLQAWINNGYTESIIAGYNGSIQVYEGDIVTVYGEGAGTLDGENRMGASMSWPLIKAKYIVKHRSDDEG